MKTVRSMSINWCLFFILVVFGVGSGQAANRDEIIFFFNDAQGSAVAAVNESGELCWSEEYTAYGDKNINDDVFSEVGCGIVGEERGFTGHTEDVNSDLVYMQQRYYDPSIGRFLSIDPLDVNPNQPMTFNRYAYANNNPYKYTDPDGRNPLLLLATPPGQAAVVTGLNAAGAAATAVSSFYAIQIAGRLQGKIFGDLTMRNESDDQSSPGDGDASNEKPRFVGQPDGTVVDTDATPSGSYDQPDGGRTDILQGEDHGAGHSHTHTPNINVNPTTGQSFINGLQQPGSPVSIDDVENIRTGEATRSAPKGR